MHHKGRPQSISFPPNYHSLELAGKLEGIKRVLKESVLKERVLKERGLWPERGSVLECPTVTDAYKT